MRATAILVRWQGGYRWVGDPDAPLRIEIAQGHSGDEAEMVRKAQAEVNTYKDGQTEITVGIDPPVGDPVWGEDIIEGDEVEVDGSFREVEAFVVSIDDATGRKTIVPQFGDLLDDPETRIARTLRAHVPGQNGGTSHLARPVASLPPPQVRP